MEETKKSIFEELDCINVNDYTEEKNGLTYLSWAFAWRELKKKYPEATYKIERFGEEKKPYLYDSDLGYMVFTSITIDNLTHEMWLPVMDGANKAMKDKPYNYKVKKWNYSKKAYEYGEKTVAPATMFDINKTIMRCLVKNIGMFGLGIYIYAGEDLPEEEKQQEELNKPNIKEAIFAKIDEATKLEIDIADEKINKFIAEHNNGKTVLNEMNEEEMINYAKVLDVLINGKIAKNASNSEQGEKK